MAEYIVMPKMGLTMKEGTIRDWQKKEGDEIALGELIFEIETDKITKDFESANAGTLLKILVHDGTVKVQEPVAIIGQPGEDISAMIPAGSAPAAQEEKKAAPAAQEKTAVAKPTGKVKISPKAKKLAQELGVDFENLAGTGPGGAISVADIEEASKAPKATPMAKVAAEALGVDLREVEADGRIRREDVLASMKTDAQEETRVPMSRMRQIIAERMKESQNISAAINLTVSCDMTEVVAMRESLKPTKKVSYNDIMMLMVARTLKEHPMLNASVEENEIVLHPRVHMGVAVAVENGLLVPVLRGACGMSLTEISDETARLAGACRDQTLNPDELEGSTFSITNLGMYGIESFTPIINQPNVAIIGINAIVKEAVVVEDAVQIRPMMKLSLTVDHRIVDGAVAAMFLSDLKKRIETPALLLL